ncbi:MAG TPA: WxL domain-containing protein [Chloroflexota bacterium]|nr:WxL domain-containing protein [Chloroflexota bacterium]
MKKIAVGLGGVLLLAAPATSALAATANATGSATINSGQYSISATNFSFGTIPLTGQDQPVNAAADQVTVTDATGTGNGWNVTLSGGALTDGTHSLPNYTINGGTLVSSTGTAGPGATVNTPAVVTAAPVKVLSDAAGAGLGQDVYAFNYNQDVPANAYASTGYTATETLTLAATP